MPDNGFGSKANSRSFILRLYKVRPNWKTEWSGTGEVRSSTRSRCRDPDGKVPFPIVNENTPERILTGGDFDVESVRQAPDGTFYFGEEFGPFIVHVDAKGRVLDAPVPLPRVFSPDNPFLLGRTPNLAGSNGFEAMALSADGKTLYPFLEGPLVGDDPLIRRVYEFDLNERRYTGRPGPTGMTQPGLFVSDAVAFGRDQLIVTERDNNQGPAAAWKKAFVIDVPDRKPILAASARSSTCSTSATATGSRCPAPAPATSASATRSSSRTRRSRRCCRCPATSCVRQRHEFRVDRPQPEPAGLQRLHRRQGARHQG